jgi:pimeloyl-ACP methyl ester carboxylesterase
VVSTAPTVTVAAPTADSAPIAAAATNVVVSQAASVAGACPTCRAFGTAALPALPGQAATAILRAAQFLDGVQHWLSGLPSNPVTEFASGALLLVRRTLFPAVPVIAVGNVTVAEGSPQAVFTVTLDKPYTSDVTVAYSTVSSSARPWAEAAELAAFAEAGVDYQVGSGILTFTPGQTSQQVSITILDDHAAEVAQTFTLDLVTPVVVASATATIVDDDYLNIDVNPNFSYGDALLAAGFSNLAYDHRNADAFTSSVQATGWEGIGVSGPSIGTNEVEPSVTGGGQNLFSPAAGGFGVQNRATQSFAFAGKRTAADGTVQFIVSFEGSNSPFSEPQDWIANAGEYGWSRYYASLEPLMTEVVGQMLQAQGDGKNTQLILTGHSLGGAVAMVAYSDLLAPEGNLWPGTSDVLAAGDRVLDTVGGWSLATRTALLAATQVYTFGAPSMLIEPTKPGTVAATALVAAALVGGRAGWLAVVAGALTALTVNDSKLPDFSGVAGINFGTRVFQFEHANTSWWPPYPGDIVAQIGSRDPGNVLQINLDNAVQRKYAGWAGAFIPASTHPIGAYRESVIRLVTNRSLLKSPNGLAQNTPQLTQTSTGNGSDARNDFFVNTSDDGKGGNDLFVYSKTGSYTPNGGGGSDTYSITGYGVSLEIDGAQQSGRDSLIFDIAGTESVQYINTGSGPLNDVAVFSVSGSGGQSSSVKITHWDRWQFSDVFQVIKPADGSWTLNTLTGIDGGPVVVAVSPVNELPISVV